MYNLKMGRKMAVKSYQIAVILARVVFIDKDPFFAKLFQSIEADLFSNSCILKSDI